MSITSLGVVVNTHQEFRDARVATVIDSATIDARPLVVIDPEDREQVGRLCDALYGGHVGVVDRVQKSLREFANPTPPKPEEPTGLGAVVEDADGADWHRTRDGRWIAEDGLRSRAAGWVHIAAVRVLSEGVTP